MEEKRKRVWAYLTSSEKQSLVEKAEVSNQRLSEYIRARLTKRTSKVQLTREVIDSRIVLSKVKQSIMMLKRIANSSSDIDSKEKIIGELDNLIDVVDPAILCLMGIKDDSSNLSEG